MDSFSNLVQITEGYTDPSKIIYDMYDRREILYDKNDNKIIRPIRNPIALRSIQLLKDAFAVDGIDGENVIQRIIRYPNHFNVWCSEQVRVQSTFTLELFNVLQGLNVNLKDGHPLNVIFEGPHPKWIDLGSLRSLDEAPGSCEQQVNQYAAIADFYHIGFCRKIRELSRYPETGEIEGMLKIFFEALAEDDPTLTFTEKYYRLRGGKEYQREGHWVGYNEEFETQDGGNSRTEYANLLNQVIDKFNVKTMVDLGCNTGQYSIIAAKRGVEVLALDIEDALICELFRYSLKEDLPITALVSDLELYCRQLENTHIQFCPNIDLFLGYAILHHMVHRADYSFKAFFNEAERFAPKAYLITFVDYTDLNLSKRQNKKDWYNLENFIKEALSRGFEAECLDTRDPTRKNVVLKRL